MFVIGFTVSTGSKGIKASLKNDHMGVRRSMLPKAEKSM